MSGKGRKATLICHCCTGDVNFHTPMTTYLFCFLLVTFLLKPPFQCLKSLGIHLCCSNKELYKVVTIQVTVRTVLQDKG